MDFLRTSTLTYLPYILINKVNKKALSQTVFYVHPVPVSNFPARWCDRTMEIVVNAQEIQNSVIQLLE